VEDFMQVSKWGNSLAVRLPKKLVDEMGLKPGDDLVVVDAAKGASPSPRTSNAGARSTNWPP
jgi:antitoxin MazE